MCSCYLLPQNTVHLKGHSVHRGCGFLPIFKPAGGMPRGVQQPAKVWGSLKQWLHTGPLSGSQGQLTSCVLGTSLTGGPAQLGGLCAGRWSPLATMTAATGTQQPPPTFEAQVTRPGPHFNPKNFVSCRVVRLEGSTSFV